MTFIHREQQLLCVLAPTSVLRSSFPSGKSVEEAMFWCGHGWLSKAAVFEQGPCMDGSVHKCLNNPPEAIHGEIFAQVLGKEG